MVDADDSAINRTDSLKSCYVRDRVKINLGDMRPCAHTRFITQVFKHPEAYEPFSYQGCAMNELLSISARHCLPQKPPSVQFVTHMNATLLRLYQKLGSPRFEPLTFDALLALKSQHVRKRFERYRATWDREIEPRDALIKSFIKFERYGPSSEGKPPRLIQYRNPGFTARLSSYYTQIEHALWKPIRSLNRGARLFAKGRNSRQRAQDLAKLADGISNPMYLLLDHSKFDSRVHVDHLQSSHRFYNLFFKDRVLSRLMRMTLRNKCVSRGGLFYTQEGRRMSGDADTALGNCVVNYAVISYILDGIDHKSYIDGDDSVICFSKADLERVQTAFLSRRSDTGMESTLEYVSKLSDVEFCQSKPIRTRFGPALARNPAKAMASMCYTLGPQRDNAYYRTVGYGELHSSSGVPLIYEAAEDLMELNPGRTRVTALDYRHRVDLKSPIRRPDDVGNAYFLKSWAPISVPRSRILVS